MPEQTMSSEQLFAARDAVGKEIEVLLAIDGELDEQQSADLCAKQDDWDQLHARANRQATTEAKRLSWADRQKAALEIPEKYVPSADDSARPTILTDPKRGFKSSGEFFASIIDASPDSPQRRVDQRLNVGAAAAGMSQGAASKGGFAVPPEFSREIWDGLRNTPNNLLSLTNNFTVTGDSLTFPKNAETSRADGSRYGGVQGYWLPEAGSITVSNPTVDGIKLEPQELFVLVPMTDKLMRNGPAMTRYVTDAATDEINTMVGNAIVNGDGVGKPAGLATAACKIQVTRTTASKFFQKDVANMWVRLHSRSMMNAVWLVDQSVLAEIMLLFTEVTNVADSENVGGFASNLYNPNGGVGWGTLVGRPIIVTEYGKQLGTSGDVYLTDLGSYFTGTRAGGIDTASSIHVYFTTAQTAFRFGFAVDGQCALSSAITPLSAGDTVSTVIDLS